MRRIRWRRSLDDPWAVAELLRELRATGADDAVTALATRAARLDDPRAVPLLLREAPRVGGMVTVAVGSYSV